MERRDLYEQYDETLGDLDAKRLPWSRWCSLVESVLMSHEFKLPTRFRRHSQPIMMSLGDIFAPLELNGLLELSRRIAPANRKIDKALSSARSKLQGLFNERATVIPDPNWVEELKSRRIEPLPSSTPTDWELVLYVNLPDGSKISWDDFGQRRERGRPGKGAMAFAKAFLALHGQIEVKKNGTWRPPHRRETIRLLKAIVSQEAKEGRQPEWDFSADTKYLLTKILPKGIELLENPSYHQEGYELYQRQVQSSRETEE